MTQIDTPAVVPDYSIIVPAYNEQEFIEHTLEHAKAAMNETPLRGELIVVDNNSDDDTATIATRCGAAVVFESENQISRARNAGAGAARGRYFIFLDADTELSGRVLVTALTHLETGRCCGGGCHIIGDREVGRLAAATVRFWNRLSERRGLAAGCFVFCLAEGFNAVGGFSERVYASEEIWFSRALKKWRRDLEFRIITDPPIVTSVRKLDWYSPGQLVLESLKILIPFGVMSKRLSSLWYRRPASSQNTRNNEP